MTSTSLHKLDLSLAPDLRPLYPTIPHVAHLLAFHSGLNPAQKSELVSHSLSTACIFGDLSMLQYLLSDPQALAHLDLGLRDEEGVGLVSLAIQNFGGDTERDVEREECVRLLVSQGADMSADSSGWTPLHYAALLSPPTLITYLMTHGCSPFAVTRRNLTPLDIVTAHSIVPGREDIAFILEESMRGEGWTGGRMEEKRRGQEQRLKKKAKREEIKQDIGRILGVSPKWHVSDSDHLSSDSDSDSEDLDSGFYTPVPDYSAMLVFSPTSLPQIFDSLISNFEPSLPDGTPANSLYLLARFACLTCDHTWLEDLIIGATDAIEETFYSRSDNIVCLVFWLYNTTVWLHLLRCDSSISEACEMLGSFELIEEVINSVFVFIVRFAERKIDELLDAAILDHSPVPSELGAVQFESEWSFLRPFASKRKGQSSSIPSSSTSLRSAPPPSPPTPQRPNSPVNTISSRGLSSLRHTITRGHTPSSAIPLSSIFPDSSLSPSPSELTSFLTALHTLLLLSDINTALITQLWSQVLYWTSCEIFNRVITRKKYICRSRAAQISMNLTAVEDWVEEMRLPLGLRTHFAPVREMLTWLQRLSSIADFPDLVATVQSMRSLNPLQMRRALRDYRFEVNEGRMTEECVQYLTQLQKDWERRRVKLGVEALRREIDERERDREGSASSFSEDVDIHEAPSIIPLASSKLPDGQNNVDLLFNASQDFSNWEPIKPPQVLGELLDSRVMLPLLFPSDPIMLAALPRRKTVELEARQHMEPSLRQESESNNRRQGMIPWRLKGRNLRKIDIGILQWVDGVSSAARWGKLTDLDHDFEDDGHLPMHEKSDAERCHDGDTATAHTHVTSFTRRPSGRGRGRSSMEDSSTPT